jgi:hypothetical protein
MKVVLFGRTETHRNGYYTSQEYLGFDFGGVRQARAIVLHIGDAREAQ